MKKVYYFLSIILIGVFATVIFTWPFASYINSFYYDRGDYQLSGATLSFNEHALRTGKIFDRNFYFHGFQFYPQPLTLAYSDLRLLPTLIYAPIYWLTHNFNLSVNLTTFTTFVFSFISSFYVIYYFTKHKSASLIGALIYTFNPLTFARFPEHFELLNKYFLPLVFFFAYKFLTVPSFKNSFLFSLLFTLNSFSAIYFQIMTIIILPIFAIPFIIFQLKKRNIQYFINLLKYSLVFLLFLPIFIYFDKAYLDFSGYEGSKRTVEENAFYSARLIDYVFSTPVNWFYGSLVQKVEGSRAPRVEGSPYGAFNYQEHSLFLNTLPMLFFTIFIWIIFKKYQTKILEKQFNFLILPFFIVLITSFIFTLGPYFQGWNSSNGSFKLPFYYLYQWIPLFQGIRAPTRFEFLFYIPFSLFVAIGVKYVFEKIKDRRVVILLTILLTGILWLENYTPSTIDHKFNESSPFLKKLEKLQKDHNLTFLQNKNTLHLPVYTSFNDVESIYLIWSSLNREKVVNGNRGSFLPYEQAVFLEDLNKKLDQNTIWKLVALDIGYIIFHKDLLGKDLGQYQKDNDLYQKAVVINNDDVLILDTKKFGYEVNKCDFDQDLKIEVNPAKVDNLNQEITVLKIGNKADCYLLSIYLNKYKKDDFYMNLLKRTAYFKLPPLLEPNQEAILSEIYGNLRWE